jgi:CBS domain-containing protein
MGALWEWVLKFVRGLHKAAFSKQSRSSIMSNGTEQAIASAADQKTRNQIAFWITFGGLIAVTILGIFVIAFAKDRSDAARLVFGSLLPLLGTWVGTVLAFYFAKANFESAARNTKDLLGITERLRSTPVESVMLKMTDPHVIKKTLVPPEKPESLKISELVEIMRDNRRNRLPVLNSDSSPLFIIHLSTLTDFISTQALSATAGSKPVTDLTISDLQTIDAQLYQQMLAWTCVKLGATLAEAKIAMEDIPGCSDVFVTTAGRKSDPVVGWLTNVEIGLRSSA